MKLRGMLPNKQRFQVLSRLVVRGSTSAEPSKATQHADGFSEFTEVLSHVQPDDERSADSELGC